jgi:hypothetical protein
VILTGVEFARCTANRLSLQDALHDPFEEQAIGEGERDDFRA